MTNAGCGVLVAVFATAIVYGALWLAKEGNK